MQKRIGKLAPYCLALVLAAAVQIGWCCAVVTLVVMGDELRRPEIQTHEYEQVVFTLQGDPLISRTSEQYAPTYDRSVTYFRPEDRRPVTEPLLEELPAAELTPAGRFFVGLTQRVLKVPDEPLDLRDPPGQIVSPTARATTCYFVTSDAATTRGYFELFSRESRRRQGYLGVRGFTESPPGVEDQFEPSMRPTSTSRYGRSVLWHSDLTQLREQIERRSERRDGARRVVSDRQPGFPFHPGQSVILGRGQAFLVDLASRSVRPIDAATDVVSITAVARPEPAAAAADDALEEGADTLLYVALRTPRSVILVHPRSERRLEFPIPADLTEDAVALQFLAGGGYVLQQAVRWEEWPDFPGGRPVDVRLWRYRNDGALTAEWNVPLQLSNQPTKLSAAAQRNCLVLSGGAPASAGVIATVLLPVADTRLAAETYASAVLSSWGVVWPSLLASLALGALSAWLIHRQQHRLRLAPERGWELFGFLLGVPGYCGYLIHRRRPAAEAPPPERLGTEIFMAAES